MRLKSLELINNPKVRNLKLDFTINNNIQDTIILAGNNGCGKTTILDTIYLLMNSNLASGMQQTEGKIKSIIVLDKSELEYIKDNIRKSNFIGSEEEKCLSLIDRTNEIEYIVDFSGEIHTYGRFKIFAIINGKKENMASYSIMHRGNLEGLMSSFYSTANINYNLDMINSITTIDLDSEDFNTKTENDIGTIVKQTFIDIEDLDAKDFQKWASENLGEKIDDSKMYIRIKRFSRAFSYMFSNLKFSEVVNSNGYKDVLFKNNRGDKISIDDLSTGEKQIVIRAGYMLRNIKSIQGNVILIDEPELSLHPEWQKKILQFYKSFFIDENGNQTAQIFVATHSPFIVHNLSRYNDKVIVLKKDEKDNVNVLEKPVYYSYNNDIEVKQAFNVNSFSFNKNVIFTEGETDKIYFNKAIEIYFNGNVQFEVEWIGCYDQNDKIKNSGVSGLDNLYNVLEANPNAFDTKIGLIYDSDTKKENINRDMYFVYTVPFNKENTQYRKGIENQLTIVDFFNFDKYYVESIKHDDYGATSTICTLDKTSLCNAICSSKEAKDILINFKNIIEQINSMF